MIDHRPRVSIGVPVYNAEQYLEQAVDSILAQTYSDFELIISDNASTDRTAEICRDYQAKDKRIRYYRNEINLGAAPNFNRTFDLASGEYFKWAAYDDVLAPDFLLKCVEVLDQNPTVSLCYPRVYIIDEVGEIQDSYDPQPDATGPDVKERFRNLILSPHLAAQVHGVMRSSVLKQTPLVGSYPSSDEVLLAELALFGPFYEIPKRLFYLRLHQGQSIQGTLAPRRARVAWFDTARKGKIVFPTWQYIFGGLRAIVNAPLGRAERAYCFIQMGRWFMGPANFRAAGKDILIATHQFLCSNWTWPKREKQEMVRKTS